MSQADRTQGAPQPERETKYHNYAAAKKGGRTHTLGSPRVAALVLAAAVLLGTLYGSHRSLTAIRPDYRGTQVEQMFIERGGTVSNLIAIAQRYDVDPELLGKTQAVTEMLSRAENENEYYDLYQSAAGLAAALATALEAQPLSEQDVNYIANLRAELDGQDNRLRHSDYLQDARAFNERLAEFPASVLGPLTGVKPAPEF